MVKRLIALTASAVCTLAISASAAESDNTAPAAVDTAVAPHVLALQQLDNAKLDEAVAKIEAAIEKLRAAGNIEGVDKDALIAQLEAAAASLAAEQPQLQELQVHLGALQGLEGLQALQDLQGLAPAEGAQFKVISPEQLAELQSTAKLYSELNPDLKPDMKLGEFLELHSNSLDPEVLQQLKKVPSDATVYGSSEVPHFYSREDVDKLLEGAPAFTPQQIEELKAQALAGADAAQMYHAAPLDPQFHAQIMELVQSHQLSQDQLAELHQQIQALVEQFVEEHAGDSNDKDSTSEDREE